MTTSIWRIGQLLNSVQSGFIGLLQIWSIPLVLLLSLAAGYATHYGLAHFTNYWIALIITIAVQSVIVICSLELASIHWRANLARFVTVLVTLLVAMFVSVSFAYFKFYEMSTQDATLLKRQGLIESDINRYLDRVSEQKGEMIAAQRQRVETAAAEANQAFLGALPNMADGQRARIGRGRVWSHYNEALSGEQNRLKALETDFKTLDDRMRETRAALRAFTMNLKNASAYDELTAAVNGVRHEADRLIAGRGGQPIEMPRLGSFAQYSQAMTPSFAMWEDLSLFALACASIVDFFTLVLAYRLEFTAPGPLNEEERDLAFRGIQEFNEFTINHNGELEFIIEKNELERARRYSDWLRMFVTAFLLNRGFLRKVDDRSVEFAPNLYPIIAERLRRRRPASVDEPDSGAQRVAVLMEKKR